MSFFTRWEAVIQRMPMARQKRKKVAFTITLVRPEEASIQEVRDYIFDAVTTHRETYVDKHPMYWLDSAKVRIKRVSIV